MSRRDPIGSTADTVGAVSGASTNNQDRLYSHTWELVAIIADLTARLTHEKTGRNRTIAERLARANAANGELERRVRELSARNRELALFSRMNDSLQTCTTDAEAWSIVTETVARLFPEDSGAVFVLNASRDMLEATATWGPHPPASLSFPANECKAHQLGQVQLTIGRERVCGHVSDDGRTHACLPLPTPGRTLGILHLVGGLLAPADAARMEEKCSVAKSLADNIGRGIANLKLRESMRSLSIRDPLTGLFNRRYMEEALDQELHRSRRNTERLAVITIDIDQFKRFNDEFGHDGGDAILRALGALFRKHVRGSDTVCRYGGEEFILILSPATPQGARRRAERIREDAAKMNLKHAGRDLGRITLSFGVALFPDHATGAAAIIKASDIALYRAKNSGRDRVVTFAHDAGQAAPQRS